MIRKGWNDAWDMMNLIRRLSDNVVGNMLLEYIASVEAKNGDAVERNCTKSPTSVTSLTLKDVLKTFDALAEIETFQGSETWQIQMRCDDQEKNCNAPVDIAYTAKNANANINFCPGFFGRASHPDHILQPLAPEFPVIENEDFGRIRGSKYPPGLPIAAH